VSVHLAVDSTRCSCTSGPLSHVVWTFCGLKGVALCISLHPVNLLYAHVSRGIVGVSELKKCESRTLKMKISFVLKRKKNTTVFLVRYFVCFKVSEMSSNFSSPVVTDC